MMQKKSIETILYSSAGVVVMLVIIIAVNVITGAFPARVDLTQEKAYTLSPGTRTILKNLDTPGTIHFYCSQAETATPQSVLLRDYARSVEDLLHEYKQVAGKNLIIQKFDPQPDSDAEDSARLDGLEPLPLSGGDQFYLGLAVNLADERVAIPFLDPNRERQLEYDLSRAITQVLSTEKPTVGIMSSLPVFGAPSNPMMEQMGQAGGGTPAWTLVGQLKQDFNVKRVEIETDKIDDDVKVLLVIHPKGISDKTQYAIDQFVLRGGKLIAFLDPVSALASRQQNPMMGEGASSSSTLEPLLKAWGIQFDTTKVVADLDFQLKIRGPSGDPMDAPTWLGLTTDGINHDDIATSQLNSLWLLGSGAFTGVPAAGLKETVLLKSTKDSSLVDAFLSGMGSDAVMKGFKAAGVNYDLAIRLNGKFKTAFPDGKPGADADKKNAADFFKESKVDTSVVLVGDSDMLADDFSLRKTESPFGEMVNPMNGNLDFAQNLIEQMAGDSNLIGIRSRASLNRPFTRITKMEADAEARGQAKIDELQQSLSESEQRLNELQQQKGDKDQRFILSPEQKAEIDNFKKKEVDVNRELKQTRKDLRKEVVSVESHLTWLNILAMPAGVTAAGIMIAVIKRKKTSAK